MTDSSILPGGEPWSHRAGAPVGVLVVHGFTGTPHGMRGIAEALAAAGFDVELPLLPGHGTTIEEMITTSWADWSGHVGDVLTELQQRVDHVVLVGQSMGGSLVLRGALDAVAAGRPPVGVVCINPLTHPREPEVHEMIADFLEDGITIAPSQGSDIADPDAFDIAYPDSPLGPLQSLLLDGVAPITDRYSELSMPLRLFTSRQDHVVPPADSERLAAVWSGPVEHTWLERGYHVATVDYDRQIVIDETVAFVSRIAGAS